VISRRLSETPRGRSAVDLVVEPHAPQPQASCHYATTVCAQFSCSILYSSPSHWFARPNLTTCRMYAPRPPRDLWHLPQPWAPAVDTTGGGGGMASWSLVRLRPADVCDRSIGRGLGRLAVGRHVLVRLQTNTAGSADRMPFCAPSVSSCRFDFGCNRIGRS
jgi:hypothetical protein